MYLVYIGESGDTGSSANDPAQQDLVYAGLVVHETQYIAMNGEYDAMHRRHFGCPPGSPEGPMGLKPADVYQGRGYFRSWSPTKRAELVQDCLNILMRRELPVVMSYVNKAEFNKAKANPNPQIPATMAGSPAEIAVDRFLFALNLYLDEMTLVTMNPDQMMQGEWPAQDYTLIVAGNGRTVEPDFMAKFLDSELEIPTPTVFEAFCYVKSEDSVCTQLADFCAYFTRRWLQDPDGAHNYFDALREGGAIQVIYQVQF